MESNNKLVGKIKRILKSQLFSLSYYKNNSSYFLTLSVLILLNIIFCIVQYFLNIDENDYVKIAKLAGILIDFNTCIIIITVLRRFTTFLRNSYYGRKFIAFDEFINIHKFIGSFLLFLGLIHALFHCINFCKFKFYSY